VSGLPDPLAGVGEIAHDPSTWSLLVKAKTGDRVWPLWRRGHQALLSDDGRSDGPRPVYASGGGGYQVARGEPVRGGWLRFRFRPADPVYQRLSAAADLSALVTVDRSAGRILGVRFRNR
jgi:hypothetical protein